MRWLYYLGIRLYVWGIRLAALWMPKARLWIQGRRMQQRLMDDWQLPQNRRRIWMHCASAGEYEQGRPVLEAIRKLCPDAFLIVSFFSPSGYEARKSDTLPDLKVYLPADLPGMAQAFLHKLRPHLALFVKYEFWYGYIHALQQQKIPCILISARFEHRSFFFRLYRPFFIRLLKGFTHIFVQDEASAQLLLEQGIRQADVSGDTRFDRVLQIAAQWQPDQVVERFLRGRKAIVAGSTWPEDEQLWIDCVRQVDLGCPMIIVPHEIRDKHIGQLLSSWPGKGIRYSELAAMQEQNMDSFDLLVVDRMGLLARIYAYGWLAYVGGGFGAGIHNILEAAVYGIPVMFGPRYRSFREARDLVRLGAAFSVQDKHAMAQLLDHLKRTNLAAMGTIAGNYVKTQAGATGKIVNYLAENRFLTMA
ncbi:MAG: 3-deoxy-D-manno-octulosonic acid transferase [Thermoflavifilum aggregans]|nr:3-deoxy-D-manno-octulosonic acid transferase [Thermoflavifilum aggregans]